MKIKKKKSNILITTDGKEVVIMNKHDESYEDKDLVVNLTDVEIPSGKIIASPGEFEISDILVNVYSFGSDLDEPSIISIDGDENIKILYLTESVDVLDKSILDKLPDTNILLMELTKENITKKLQIVNDIEPDIFVPLSDKSIEEDLAKDLGVKDVEEMVTLNFSHKDFTEESSDLLVYFLK